MKNGYFRNSDGEKIVQSMVFENGPHKGKAKGLKQVCLERFGENVINGLRQDALGNIKVISHTVSRRISMGLEPKS